VTAGDLTGVLITMGVVVGLIVVAVVTLWRNRPATDRDLGPPWKQTAPTIVVSALVPRDLDPVFREETAMPEYPRDYDDRPADVDRDPPLDILGTHEHDHVGDVISGEYPVVRDVPQPPPPIPVYFNVAFARRVEGRDCIQVDWPNRAISRAEAAQISMDLEVTQEQVATIRRQLGFDD
jgi:hypothetical protein